MKKELSVKQSEILMGSVIVARSTSFVMSKMSMSSLEPINILALRFSIAFIILLFLFRDKILHCDRESLVGGVCLGITYSIVMTFEMFGMLHTESSMASLIENSAFMLVPVLEILFLHVFPTKMVTAGMILSFIGVITLNFGPGMRFNIGSVYLAGAMVFYAVAIFETAIFSRRGDPITIGTLQIGTMAVLTTIASLIFEDFSIPSKPQGWIMIFLLAVLCTVFGFTLQPLAQRKLAPDRAGMFSALNPLAAMIWGLIILGERITTTKFLGATFILVGIILPVITKEGVETSLRRARKILPR